MLEQWLLKDEARNVVCAVAGERPGAHFGAAARNDARSALQGGEKSATPQARFVGLITLGTAHRLNGEWDDAVRVLGDALDAAISGANRMIEGWLRSELAKALLGRGERDRAEQEAQAAVVISRAQHSRYEELRGALALAQVLLGHPDALAMARIDETLASAQALIDETGALAFQAELHECRARLAMQRGDKKTAAALFELALKQYDDIGAPLQVARLQKELGA